MKAGAQHAAGRAREEQVAPQHLDVGADLTRHAGHVAPQGVEGFRVVRCERTEPQLCAAQAIQAEVAGAGHLDHLAALFDQRDEGREQLAVDAILVEVVGRTVRGRHQHGAQIEQRLEQTTQDHGVGDVGDLELVETEQARLPGDELRHRTDRIVALVRAETRLARRGVPLAPLADQAVHLRHEDLEVVALFVLNPRGVEEQVHQHGLAPPRRAPEINPPRRRGGRKEREHGIPQAPELALQPRQGVHRLGLARVGFDVAVFQKPPVSRASRLGHRLRLTRRGGV